MIAPEISKDFETWLSNFRPGVYDDCPRYRVVFGPNQRDHLGRQKYVSPNGGLLECWILEQWQPAKFFGTPLEWEKNRFFYDDVSQSTVDVKGEYPSRGRYVMVLPLTENGTFLPLSEQLKDEIAIRIRANESFAYLLPTERAESLEANYQREQHEKAANLAEADGKRDEYYKTHWGRINRQGTRAYSMPN